MSISDVGRAHAELGKALRNMADTGTDLETWPATERVDRAAAILNALASYEAMAIVEMQYDRLVGIETALTDLAEKLDRD